MILNYIEHETNIKILIEIFDLGNAVLLGGNTDIQNLIYYKIKERNQNCIFKKIDDNIHKLFAEILTVSKICNKLSKKKSEKKL